MKILQVIHGYPMRYNAGSEVYTQTLCHGLSDRHEVHVFTREEDPFAPDFRLRAEPDPDDAQITLHVVNNPRNRDRYREPGIDRRFAEVIDRVRPDLVHMGHLNHLSTSLPFKAATRGIPVVYTLHDFWIMCPRGQFMQTHPSDPEDLWAACDGQDDRKCAERCYARYFGGAPAEREEDVAYWTGWVRRRMHHLRETAELVDLFAPPRALSSTGTATSSGSPPASWSISTTASISRGCGAGRGPPASPSSSATSARTSRRRGSTI